MTVISKFKRALLCGVAFACMTAGSAAAAAPPSPTVGEVIITAQRRQSTVQNTAATINVVTARKLEQNGVASVMQLQFATAGLNIAQDLGLQTQIFIRGIGSNLQGIGTGNSVATYVDGVYIPNSIQSAQDFLGVDRVEVLKGPQATLYGRNATGGAILIDTAEPKMNFNGEADASYGNYNSYSARFRVDLPLVADKLSLGVSGGLTGHDGYVTNLYYNKKLDFEHIGGVRVALRWQPTNDVDVVLRADYTNSLESDVYKLTPATSVYYYTTPQNSYNPVTETGNFSAGPQYYSPNPRDVYYNTNNRNPSQDRGVSATIKWNTPVGTITSVTSERLFNAGPINADNDNEPLAPAIYGFTLDSKGTFESSSSFYHETYLTSNLSGPWKFVAGGNYFYDRETATAGSLSPILPTTYSNAHTSAWSVYLDGSFDVTDQIRFVAGVRYSSETKYYDTQYVNTGVFPFQPVWATPGLATFTSTNPRFGIEYRPAPGTLLYFTATSGFKSGGFNQAVPTGSTSVQEFAPEKVWSYEGGLKTSLFDNRVRIATSLFYYDYTDIQVLQYLAVFEPGIGTTLTQKITNGASASIYGWDLDGDWAATDRLTVGGSLELLHTAFGSSPNFCDPLYFTCTLPSQDENIKGNPLARAPVASLNLYGDYQIPVDIPGKLTLHLAATYRGMEYFTVFKNPYYSSGPIWLANANLRYDSPKGWWMEAFGENLFNQLVITNMINSSPLRNQLPGPDFNQIIVGTAAQFDRFADPRTFGVRIGAKF